MFDWFNNKSINKKGRILFATLFLQALITLVSVMELSKIQTFTKLQGEHFFLTNQAIDRVKELSVSSSSKERFKLLFNESPQVASMGLYGLILNAEEIVNICLDRLNFAERRLFAMVGLGEVVSTCERGIVESSSVLNLLEKVKLDGGSDVGKDGFKILDSSIANISKDSQKFADMMPKVTSLMTYTVFTLVPLIMLITIIFLYVTMRDLRFNLSTLSIKMKTMRENNSLCERVTLNREITSETEDELLHVCHDFNLMVSKFETVVQQISSMSQTLHTATKPLYSASQQSKEKMSEQNSKADEIVAIMEGFVQAIDEISKNTNDTSESASDGYDVTQQGRRTIESARESMTSLSNSSQQMTGSIAELDRNSEKIASIIDVIGDISEQTNLLALNAAIEAARAGEQGRGFAVVADEVRTLASRTQESTEQIRNMISGLQSDTQNSVSLIRSNEGLVDKLSDEMTKTDDSLSDIAKTTEKIKDMNIQIATATVEQQYVVDEIQNGVNLMKVYSVDTTEAVNNMLEGFQTISGVINDMTSTVSTFKVSS